MQRKRLISIVLILILALSACGKAEKTVKKGKTREPAEIGSGKITPSKGADPTPTPEPEKTEIVMWCIATEGDSMHYAYEQAIALMKDRYPTVDFRWEAFMNDDYKMKVKTAAQADMLPDIFYTWPCYFLEDFVLIDRVYCLDDTYKQYADFLPETMCRNTTYNGKKYGIPLTMNVVGLFADMTVLDEAGYTEIPKTIEDFYACCDRLLELGKTPIGLSRNEYATWCVMEVLEPLMQRFAGSARYDAILRGRETWDDEDIIAAVDCYLDMVNRGYFGKEKTVYDNDEVKYYFMNHEYGFYMNGSWNCADFANSGYGEDGWVQVGAFPVVDASKSDGIEFIGGPYDTLAVSSGSENPELAAQYAFELAREISRYAYLSGCGVPAWKIDYEEREINYLTKNIAHMVAESDYLVLFGDVAMQPYDVDTYYGQVNSIMFDGIDGATFAQNMSNYISTDPGKRGLRDLGGREIVFCDYYTNPDTWDIPQSYYQEAFFDMLHDAETQCNFKFSRTSVDGYGPVYVETAALSITNNEPIGDLILLDNRWVGSLLSSGLLLDVSNATSVNWDDDKWNKAVLDVMSINGALYGFSAGTEARTGVFFNRALFKALGIDPDLPYDLQREGKWSWDEFLKLCAKLTVDMNNDGKTDVYGVVGQDWIVAFAALQSNGTFVITKDENGLLKMNADDPDVIRAMEFVQTLHEKGYFMPTDKTAKDWSWDWFRYAFEDGKAAMRIDEEWVSYSQLIYAGMDYGFACFPYGPAVGRTIAVVRDDVIVIPNCDKTRTCMDDILFAYDIYTDVPAGFADDDIRWQESFTVNYGMHYNDWRAIDETIRMLVVDCPGYMYPACLIPDFDNYSYMWTGGFDDGLTAMEIIESYRDEWEYETETFNRAFR
ncbi:MAG: extracellular solute-binding protein [Lachnospiraceae bacterium]|nr:extracellular solute-binding protein [Lachnospiraceae bacterium]